MIELNEIYATRTKPRKGPNCGSRKIVTVKHELQWVTGGGVLVRHFFERPAPVWMCLYCGMEIHKATDLETVRLF